MKILTVSIGYKTNADVQPPRIPEMMLESGDEGKRACIEFFTQLLIN